MIKGPGNPPDDPPSVGGERARQDIRWYVEMGLTPEHAAEWVRHTLPGASFRLEHARDLCGHALKTMNIEGLILDSDHFERSAQKALEEAVFLDTARSSLRSYIAVPDLIIREFLKSFHAEYEARTEDALEQVLRAGKDPGVPSSVRHDIHDQIARYEDDPATCYKPQLWRMPDSARACGRLGQDEFLFGVVAALVDQEEEIRGTFGE